jgi:hypothetical protein
MNPSIGSSLTGKRYEWFYCDGEFTKTTPNRNWYTWIKPPELTLITIICVGGGGGGGHGGNLSTTGGSWNGISATNAYGGEGGGGGAATVHTMPAYLVPNVLYISPGWGGRRGTTTSVSSGETSFASVWPSTELPNSLCFAKGGTGGVWGQTTFPGGVGGVIASVNDNSMTYLGITQAYAGIDGGNANHTSTTTADVTAFTANPFCCGGAGGSGATNVSANGTVGGDIITGGFWPTLSGGSGSSGAAAASSGLNGFINVGNGRFLFSVGGTGGGGTGTAAGAWPNVTGGDGGLGSGGAGGGGGVAGGGDGGAGGNGYVLITGVI